MLPFTAISFVKKTTIDPPANCDSDSDDEPEVFTYESSAAEYYTTVVNEPSTATPIKTESRAVEIPLITPKAVKELQRNICNDEVRYVKSWLARYFPNLKTTPRPDLSLLSDCYGCNVAMTCVTHKSYETLKLLLKTAPSLAEGTDYYGNSFHDVVRSVNDMTIERIVAQYSTPTVAPSTTHTPTPLSYCDVCQIEHSDPDHVSSISHVFAEKRPILEVNPHLLPDNVGYQMMTRTGWTESQGLGEFTFYMVVIKS